MRLRAAAFAAAGSECAAITGTARGGPSAALPAETGHLTGSRACAPSRLVSHRQVLAGAFHPRMGSARRLRAHVCVSQSVGGVLEARGRTSVFTALAVDERCRNAKPYIDVGVTVMRIEPGDCNYSLVGSSGNSVERQNQLEASAAAARLPLARAL